MGMVKLPHANGSLGCICFKSTVAHLPATPALRPQDPEETSSHHPLWTLRTPEEAAAAWNAEFQPGTASPPSANKETVA